MSHAVDEPQKSVEDLSSEERKKLEMAHARLRAAVDKYEPFIGQELDSRDAHVHSAGDMAAARSEVHEAEAELWRLREELLGWRRPGWAPSATSVTDWFSEEDSAYDEYEMPSPA